MSTSSAPPSTFGDIAGGVTTFFTSLAGTSSGTAYVESIAGIRVGARTGRHRELSPTLWILSAISVGLLGLESR